MCRLTSNTAWPTQAFAGATCCSNRGPEVHEAVGFEAGRCQIAVAGRREVVGQDYNLLATVRVATKYPRITTEYFHQRGIPIEVVALSGSVELAPLLGLSDRIVDLVETGRTLRENGLEVIDVITESTARLIVNRASFISSALK